MKIGENWLFIGVFIIKILFFYRCLYYKNFAFMSEVHLAVDIRQCHSGPEYDLCGLCSVLRRSCALRWRSVVAV